MEGYNSGNSAIYGNYGNDPEHSCASSDQEVQEVGSTGLGFLLGAAVAGLVFGGCSLIHWWNNKEKSGNMESDEIADEEKESLVRTAENAKDTAGKVKEVIAETAESAMETVHAAAENSRQAAMEKIDDLEREIRELKTSIAEENDRSKVSENVVRERRYGF